MIQNNHARNLPKSGKTETKLENRIEDKSENVTVPSVTWITMGLCWSGNAQILGKNNFPYKEAVPMSTQLWNKFTPAKVKFLCNAQSSSEKFQYLS